MTKLVNIRYVIEFNVPVAVMDKISNFPLNSIRMPQPHYFRDINYYMLKKLFVARKGVDIAPCPIVHPPKYDTDLHCWVSAPAKRRNRVCIITCHFTQGQCFVESGALVCTLWTWSQWRKSWGQGGTVFPKVLTSGGQQCWLPPKVQASWGLLLLHEIT